MQLDALPTGRSIDDWRRIASALDIRIAALEQEQRDGTDEFDWLHARGDEILVEICERQAVLRMFRQRRMAISPMLREVAA